MKRLIVNGDDFGASRGINLGVIEAYENGILTSASMMVDAMASQDGAQALEHHPDLGVGLHAVLESTAARQDPEKEIERQLERFTELMGRAPSHIDSHHHVHRDPDLLPAFLAAAERHRLPLRCHCGVRHISAFYGRRNGESDLDQVGPDALARILAAQVEDGFNELCCHPGYVDDELVSSYTLERRAELETLCDPRVAALVRGQGIRLATFSEVPHSIGG